MDLEWEYLGVHIMDWDDELDGLEKKKKIRPKTEFCSWKPFSTIETWKTYTRIIILLWFFKPAELRIVIRLGFDEKGAIFFFFNYLLSLHSAV